MRRNGGVEGASAGVPRGLRGCRATALLSVMAKGYHSVVSNMLLEEVNCEERNKLNV